MVLEIIADLLKISNIFIESSLHIGGPHAV